MIEKFVQAKNLIDRAQKIILATHERPDGDAIGSILALKIGLEKLEKKIVACCLPVVPPAYHFLPGASEIKNQLDQSDWEGCDLVIGVDYGSFSRLGLGDNLERRTIDFLTIDHHLVGRHRGWQILGSYSSTSEMLYYFLVFLKVPLDRRIATSLLTGIFDDTGGFRHVNTKAQTLKVAGELLLKGVSMAKIARALARSNPAGDIKLWNQIFERLETDLKSGLASSHLSYQDVASLGAESEVSVSDVANILSSAPEVKLAAILIERAPGRIDGCLRAQRNKGVNAAKIAEVFGGGGHYLAAGFQTSSPWREIIQKIKGLVIGSTEEGGEPGLELAFGREDF